MIKMNERVETAGFYGGNIKVKGDLSAKEVTVTGPGVVIDETATNRSKQRTDLCGEYFTRNTYFGKHKGDGVDAMFHHGHPLLFKSFWGGNEQLLIPESLYKLAEGLARHRFKNAVKARFDEDTGNLMATLVLNMRNEYEEYIAKWAAKGLLSWSSATAPHMGLIDYDTGEIKSWPIIEFSLTPTPAEPRTLVHVGESSKALAGVKSFLSYNGVSLQGAPHSPHLPSLKAAKLSKLAEVYQNITAIS